MTIVVHCKKEPFDIYIGRPSKWGNPFSHMAGTKAKWLVSNRTQAIEFYEKWLLSQPDLVFTVKYELKDKVLGCWCKPQACHGDVLARIADE